MAANIAAKPVTTTSHRQVTVVSGLGGLGSAAVTVLGFLHHPLSSATIASGIGTGIVSVIVYVAGHIGLSRTELSTVAKEASDVLSAAAKIDPTLTKQVSDALGSIDTKVSAAVQGALADVGVKVNVEQITQDVLNKVLDTFRSSIPSGGTATPVASSTTSAPSPADPATLTSTSAPAGAATWASTPSSATSPPAVG